MRKIILTIVLISLTVNCKKENIIMQNSHINDKNLVEEISKQIKHYPSEKVYSIDYNANLIFFEFFINDLQIEKNFSDFSKGSAFELNPFIFKSGKYSVKYKMYSGGIVDNQTYDVLNNNSYLDLFVRSYDLKNKQNDDVTYLHYKTQSKKNETRKSYNEEKFVGAEKKYYEGNFDIEIEVPYNITPDFENAQDLTKLDKKHLEQKVLEKYNQIREVYAKKNADDIAKLIYAKTILEFQTTYADKEKVAGYWKLYKNILLSDDFTMLPIENYKMEFFYDGRLVALISQSKEPKLRNEPALAGKYKNQISSIKHYLYLPKGETEFKVY
ncbi:hypothetical protein [Flavobacterium davisii]|uniref:hypothetical protein n=1 Tax=Flavobacterium davisii TaxID=2906077 RepID=UPI0035CF88C0